MELFLQGLPPNVRMVLASRDAKSLEDLAQFADKIIDVAPPTGPSDVVRTEAARL